MDIIGEIKHFTLIIYRRCNFILPLFIDINLVIRQPRRFAEILERFLLYAGPYRPLYASGCAVEEAANEAHDLCSMVRGLDIGVTDMGMIRHVRLDERDNGE